MNQDQWFSGDLTFCYNRFFLFVLCVLATIHLGKLSSSVEKSGLKFKYETLEKATEFFDPSRKLGQGASGSVYKVSFLFSFFFFF